MELKNANHIVMIYQRERERKRGREREGMIMFMEESQARKVSVPGSTPCAK